MELSNDEIEIKDYKIITQIKNIFHCKEFRKNIYSKKSNFITGCSIPIDGGTHLRSHESIAKQ